MGAEHEEGNQLRNISGIGRARHQWLTDQMGIESLTDLASASAKELFGELRRDGHAISLAMVTSWVEAAKVPVGDVTEQSGGQATRQRVRRDVSQGQTRDHPSMQEFITFVLEIQADQEAAQHQYQTSVHDMNADVGFEWEGIAVDHAKEWIEARLDELGIRRTADKGVDGEPTQSTITATPTAGAHGPERTPGDNLSNESVLATIEDYRITQHHNVAEGTSLPAVLLTRPFELRVEAQAFSPEGISLLDLELYARDRASGKIVRLGEAEAAADSEASFSIRFENLLLRSGRYTFYCLSKGDGAIQTKSSAMVTVVDS